MRFRVCSLLLLVALLVWPQAGSTADYEYAGIVIRHGDGRMTYAYVPLSEEINGIELLRRSGISLVTVGFGGLGEGVCSIDNTGCGIGDCRKRLCQEGGTESPYWRYFRQTDPGEWTAAPLGGSATRVSPGDVDGWSWTNQEAHLPSVPIEAIPAFSRMSANEPGESHTATYSASGVLLEDVDDAGAQPLLVYATVAIVFATLAIAAIAMNRRGRP